MLIQAIIMPVTFDVINQCFQWFLMQAGAGLLLSLHTDCVTDYIKETKDFF